MVEALRSYTLLCRMWIRAAFQYRVSVILLLIGQIVITGMEFAAVVIVFAHVDALAGFSLAEVLFLYGTTCTSFGLTEATIGAIDYLGRKIRDGSLDAMLIRPVGVLTQLAAEGFTPRRFGQFLQGLGVLVAALATMDVHWTPGRVLMVPVMLACGSVIFAAVFVIGSTFQFIAGDAAELQNTATHGGRFLTQYPLVIYGRDTVRLLTFGVPLAFVNWQPALYVLDRADPYGLPSVLRFASPLVAVLLVALAAVTWRAGLRRYRSTGS